MMKRVVIVGNAGGGKTTLSKRLGEATGLPVVFLDQVMWKPGWNAISPAEFDEAHRDLITRDEWIIEGMGYDETLESRFGRADTIVFLDFPLSRHFWWAAKRQFKCLFRKREDWVEGCPMLPKTLYIVRIMLSIHRKTRPRILRLLGESGPETNVFHIRSVRQLRDFSCRFC